MNDSQMYTAVDPEQQDLIHMWDDTDSGKSSHAYRNLAMVHDVNALCGAAALLLMPGWQQYPEAVAMHAVATAMGRHITDIPEHAFTRTP